MGKNKEKYDKTLESALYSDTPKKPGFFTRLTDNWFWLLITSFFLLTLGGLFGGIITFIISLLERKFPDDAGFIQLSSAYLGFIGYWIVLIGWCLIFKVNRPIVKTISTKLTGNDLKHLFLGFGLGFGLNGICILAAFLNHSIELKFAEFNIFYVLVLAVAVFIQSAAEEYLCRGFLYYRLQRRYSNKVVPIAVSSAFFGLAHLMNDGVTVLSILNIISIGVLFAFCIYYFDSMWCAAALHAAWNFTQNIIFGLPNSGTVSTCSIFELNTDTDKNSLFYDTGFGVEGTVFVNIIIIISLLVVFFMFKNKRKNTYNVWNPAQETTTDNVQL